MLAGTQDDAYFQRMASSLQDKARILPLLAPGRILDVGAGGGELSAALNALGNHAYALDGSTEAVKRMQEKGIRTRLNYSHEIAEVFPAESFNSVVCSSILHEVFSYGDGTPGSAFTVRSLEDTLRQIRQVLVPEGTLVIRDGIAPAHRDETMTLRFKDPDGVRLAEKYLSIVPFRSDVTPVPRHRVGFTVDPIEKALTGDAGSVMEFLYTYTWGEKSFPRETQEFYGVFTLTEYVAFLEGLGFKVTHAEEYLQEGYTVHLREKAVLYRADGSEAPYPMSNCLIAAEKI